MIKTIKDIVVDAYNKVSVNNDYLFNQLNKANEQIKQLEKSVEEQKARKEKLVGICNDQTLKINTLEKQLADAKAAHDKDADGIAWFGQMLAEHGKLYFQLSELEELQEGDIVVAKSMLTLATPGTHLGDQTVAFRIVQKPTEVTEKSY